MSPRLSMPRRLPGRLAVNRDLAVLFLFVSLFALPFLAQPFHMDDNFYMDMARNARVKPLFPNDTPYTFMGEQLRDMGSHSHPPLQTYFLAILQRVAGEGPGTEWIYHSVSLLHPLLAALSFYFLAARFVQRPLWPALVFAACPLFLVMQHSLMTDVPTLAFWVAAIATFLWASELGHAGLYLASSLFQVCAVFSSYQAVALTPLLVFYHLRKRGRAVGWICLAVPILLLTSWFALNYAHYHRLLLFDTAGYVSSRNPWSAVSLWRKLLAVLQYQGWLGIFPLFLLYVWGRPWRWRALGLAVLGSMFVAQFVVPSYRPAEKAIFVTGVVTGLFVLLRYFRLAASWNDPAESGPLGPSERQFFALWYFGVCSYCVLLFTEGSARYTLPLLPPVVLLFFLDLEAREVGEYRAERRPLLSSAMVASGALTLSLAWGIALSHADLDFARIYPRAAQDFARIVGGMEGRFGGEWGFRYYFSQVGVRQLPQDEREVGGGSWVVLPRLALPYNLAAPLSSMMMPVLTLAYEPRTPLRLLDLHSPSGFYSTGWGLLPFSLSRKSLEEIEVSQVNFLVEALPRARIQTPGGDLPFATLCDLQGTRLLSLEGKTPVRIGYPWNVPQRVQLDLKCGVHPEGPTTPAYRFVVRQVGDGGSIISQAEVRLRPGVSRQDRGWRPVSMPLNPAAEPTVLEVAVETDLQPGRWCIGGAVLRPADHR